MSKQKEKKNQTNRKERLQLFHFQSKIFFGIKLRNTKTMQIRTTSTSSVVESLHGDTQTEISHSEKHFKEQ